MQLTIRNLSKTYPNGVKALDDVSLDIPTGMYGLLGPNGAGKSTLMRTLATLQEADSGTATLDNINVLEQKDDVRRLLGYLPQEFGVYARISAAKMLDHLAVLKGITKNSERKEMVNALLERVNLWSIGRRPFPLIRGVCASVSALPKPYLATPNSSLWMNPPLVSTPASATAFITFFPKLVKTSSSF